VTVATALGRSAVHMTTVHSPTDPRIFAKECRSLAEAGWTVTLVAPGERDDTRDGVRIRAVQPRHRLARMTLGVLDAYRVAREIPADVYHLHDPELIAAGLLLRLRRRRVIYDAHEDLPAHVLAKSWIPRGVQSFASAFSAWLLKLVASYFTAIVAVTESVAARFPVRKTVVVHNFPRLEDFSSTRHNLPYAARPAHLAYAGGISELRGLREMVAATARLPAELGARLILIGRFQPASLQAEVGNLPGADGRVEVLGWRSPSAVAELLGESRIGLCLLHPLQNYMEGMPTKLFEYMAAGLPVIASDFPLWRSIVDPAGCGILVDPLDVKAIAGAATQLLRDPKEAEEMGQRGRAAVEARYSWSSEASKLLALYERLASR
jgi:glycosyltransferase involved in cell wall biosynthesis